MEGMLFILMVVHGHDEACNILKLKHYLHSSFERA